MPSMEDTSKMIKSNGKPSYFKCHLCAYMARTKGGLKSHYAVHSNDRPFACDTCSYEAKRMYDLKKHKIIRHGKRNLVSRRNSKNQEEKTSVNKKQTYNRPDPEISPTRRDSEGSLNEEEDTPLRNQSVMNGGQPRDPPVFPEPQVVNEESLVIVKPEPPDDYYHMQMKSHYSSHYVDDGEVLDMTIRTNQSDRSSSTPPSGVESSYMMDCENQQNPPPGETEPDDPPIDVESNHKNSEFSKFSPQESHAIDMRQTPSPRPKHAPALLAQMQHENTSPKSLIRSESSVISMLLQRNVAQRIASPVISVRNVVYPAQALTYPTAPSLSSPGALKVSSVQEQRSLAQRSHCSGDESADESTHSSLHNTPSTTTMRNTASLTRRGFHCVHCDILFFDSAIYFMHMGLHDTNDPWSCNLCGESFHDVYSFTSHFVNQHK